MGLSKHIKLSVGFFIILILVVCTRHASAHVQLLIPTEDPAKPGAVDLDVRFVEHAMHNGPLIDMGSPDVFGVLVNGAKVNLLENLEPVTSNGKTAFQARFQFKDPGAHVFYLQPKPYWEPAEQVMVVHYTKVVANSCAGKLETESELGWENWEGWDGEVGFPVEIEPLVQCTSMWTGAVFRGVVRLNGKRAPLSRIEVEYLNEDGAVKEPNNSYITQIIKADMLGQFSFAMPRAGWWAFTALPDTGETMMSPDGTEVEAELGGVILVKVTDME